MLINFSNHASGKWDKKQIDAAGSYGEIVDVAFPDVNPQWGCQEIDRMAERYSRLIAAMRCSGCFVVHVMGEMTFTYAVVVRLKAKGIVCIASTTERHATETSSGHKVSEFSFVRFREY